MTITSRFLHIIALLCVSGVVVALISQHAFGMRPCAWCVFQRLLFLAIALVCWVGVWAARRNVRWGRAAAAMSVVLSIGGVIAAWYQYTVASTQFSCAMTFADRFMVSSGLDAGMPWLFGIQATCMDARVDLLGIEYALWGMGLFVVTGVLGLIAILRRIG